MNDDIIGAIALGALLGTASIIIIRAWLASSRKRRNLAAAYERATVDRTSTEPLRQGQLVADAGEGRVRAAAGGSGGSSKQATVRREICDGRGDACIGCSDCNGRGGYTAPAFPADPSPAVFGDPVSLSSTAFEGQGGSFGGGGASGGWDAPSAAGGHVDSSSPSCDSGSAGGDSGCGGSD